MCELAKPNEPAKTESVASAVPSFNAQAGAGPDRLRPGPVLGVRGRVLELAAKARTRGPRRVDEARDAVRKTVAQLRGLVGSDRAGGLCGRDLRLGVRGERGDEAVTGLARGRSGDLREGLAGLHLGAQVSGGGAARPCVGGGDAGGGVGAERAWGGVVCGGLFFSLVCVGLYLGGMQEGWWEVVKRGVVFRCGFFFCWAAFNGRRTGVASRPIR